VRRELDLALREAARQERRSFTDLLMLICEDWLQRRRPPLEEAASGPNALQALCNGPALNTVVVTTPAGYRIEGAITDVTALLKALDQPA